MAIASRERDPDEIRRGLERWFRARVANRVDGGTDVAIASVSRPATGLSSETLFVDLARTRGDAAEIEPFVVRLPPAGDGLFPEYRLDTQVMIQQRLVATAVPVASPIDYESDESWIGTDFVVMPRVPGRVLATFPSFLLSGWLHDASPSVQRTLHEHFVDVLASIHQTPWEPLGLGGIARGAGSPVAAEIDWWASYLEWASDAAPLSELADGLAWCRERRPTAEPAPSLLWGDVQLANAVFRDDGATVAVLDWEMASIGPAELDLGWFLALHSMTVEANGGADLPGFLGRDELVDRYAAALGRGLVDLDWFETFALVRSGAIMQRVARLLAARGIDDSWLTRGNPTIERLRVLPG